MSAPLISIPLPTIAGREQWYERAVAAYVRTTPNVQVITIRDAPTCGEAWRRGLAMARGDYIHFGADDVEMHPGWWEAAVAVIDAGYLPAPRVVNSDGSLQTCGDEREMEDGEIPAFTRGPFVSREQWERLRPMIPLHYFTDTWVTFRGRQIGIETVVCRGYEYTHHSAAEGRMDCRMRPDRQAFEAYCKQAEILPDPDRLERLFGVYADISDSRSLTTAEAVELLRGV